MGLFNFFKKKFDDLSVEAEKAALYRVNPYEVIYLKTQIGRKWDEPYLTWELNNLYDEFFFCDDTYKKIKKHGWIKPSDGRSALSKLTIAELKDIASEHSITVKGKKADIVEAVSSALSDADIEALNLPKLIQATDLGNEILKANDHLMYIKENRKTFTCNLKGLQKYKTCYPDTDIKTALMNGLSEEDFYYFHEDEVPKYGEDEKEQEQIIKEYKAEARHDARDNYKFAMKYLEKDESLN